MLTRINETIKLLINDYLMVVLVFIGASIGMSYVMPLIQAGSGVHPDEFWRALTIGVFASTVSLFLVGGIIDEMVSSNDQSETELLNKTNYSLSAGIIIGDFLLLVFFSIIIPMAY